MSRTEKERREDWLREQLMEIFSEGIRPAELAKALRFSWNAHCADDQITGLKQIEDIEEALRS